MGKSKYRKNASKGASGGNRWYVSGKEGKKGKNKITVGGGKSKISSESITSAGDLVELQTPEGIKMVTQSKYDAEMREGKGIIASPRHFSSNDIIMDNYTDASGNAVVSQKEGGGYNDLRSLDWIEEIKKDGKPKTQVTD